MKLTNIELSLVFNHTLHKKVFQGEMAAILNAYILLAIWQTDMVIFVIPERLNFSIDPQNYAQSLSFID